MSDKKLLRIIRDCIRNKRTAQKEFYDLFAGLVYSICKRYGKTEADTQDIFNESFVKIYTNLENLKALNSIEGWISRICVNTAIDYIRKHKSSINMTHSLADISEQEIPRDIWTGDANSEIIDLRSAINKLKTLKPTHYLVFNLYVIDGYNHNEIGDKLGIKSELSRYHLMRARKFLKSFLNSENAV